MAPPASASASCRAASPAPDRLANAAERGSLRPVLCRVLPQRWQPLPSACRRYTLHGQPRRPGPVRTTASASPTSTSPRAPGLPPSPPPHKAAPPSASSEAITASVSVHTATSSPAGKQASELSLGYSAGSSAAGLTQAPSPPATAKRCPFTGMISTVQTAAVATGERGGHALEGDSLAQAGTPRIPGPEPWDALNNLRDLSVIATRGIEEATLHYGQKYGPICRFSNGVSAWTFVNDADMIQHICSTNARNYNLRFLPAIYEHVTQGRGILGSQGEYNRVHRKMCQPPFMKPTLLAQFSHTISRELAGLVAAWRSAHGGRGIQAADMALHMQRLTLNLIGLVAFSKDFGQLKRIQEDPRGEQALADAGSDRLLLAVNKSQQLMANVFITPLPVLRALHWLKEPGMMRLDNALHAMRDVMMDVIEERRSSWKATGVPGDDLLGVLLQAKDEHGVSLTNEELWEDVHDVMGAGHETTATTMTASLFLISQHAPVLAKVQAEVESSLQGRPPTFDDVASGRLPYTLMAVKETLRMYPPIPLFPRQVAEDDWLPGGYHLPKGDVVFMSTYAMGRNERYWPDPLSFQPERFSPEQEASRSKFCWVPFGAGPRMCLGANFAVLAVTQVVATLLQNFSFKAVSPQGQSLPYAYDITMNFPGGVRMTIEPR